MLPLLAMHSEQVLRDQVALATGRLQDGAPILKLKGDASNRSYYRVGTRPDSYVVMVMPPDAPRRARRPPRASRRTELPFVNVHRYLDGLGVRVPRILRYDEPAGMMVLEDLGDLTFERALDGVAAARSCTAARWTCSPGCAPPPRPQPDPACLAFTRAFDEDLYDWELHHFREWGLEAWSGEEAHRRRARRAGARLPRHRRAGSPPRRVASPTATTRAATSW